MVNIRAPGNAIKLHSCGRACAARQKPELSATKSHATCWTTNLIMSANIKVNHLQRWTHDGVWMWTPYTCTEQNSTHVLLYRAARWPETDGLWPLNVLLDWCYLNLNFSCTAPSTDWLQEGNKSMLRAGAGIKMEFLLEINWFFFPVDHIFWFWWVFLCSNSQRWFLGLVQSFYLRMHQRRFRLHLQTLRLWFVGLFQAISELCQVEQSPAGLL